MATPAAFWDNVAPKYAKSPISDVPAYEHTLSRVAAHLSKTDHVLEVGCGTGTTALHLADGVHQITGTDISGKMVEIARSKADDQMIMNAEFVAAGLQDLDLAPGTFDAVLAFNLFHLIPDLEADLALVAQKVRPGGLLISKTPCLGGRYRILMPMVGTMRLFGKAPYVRFLRTQEMAQHIRDAGFDILETGNFPKAPPAHFIVARKRA
ncbi:class I SAM-dependent methyltransferase [Pontivivens insulae]|uniref:Demethylrebeccamycin-D-glucose O-methyltransferase n=1 Tax=Pontivivens insulae TaxID=1639689 RepID=A0A2R8AFH7_9RHOB|nr:class I SAM-dependent methyltransferase [Pontivivens insulae]RED12237.1 ubiquinone/menaquinone biosynthesis C-methylase UbiE [Pontivivens insulae]SPF30994.1 Demethylrebeccamycin-D-glucose O-methyltransferase [Pontivivens insulae]